MVDCWFILLHPTTVTTSKPRHLADHGAQAHAVPLPSPEGCGPVVLRFKAKGKEYTEGGPMKWEAQTVCPHPSLFLRRH